MDKQSIKLYFSQKHVRHTKKEINAIKEKLWRHFNNPHTPHSYLGENNINK